MNVSGAVYVALSTVDIRNLTLLGALQANLGFWYCGGFSRWLLGSSEQRRGETERDGFSERATRETLGLVEPKGIQSEYRCSCRASGDSELVQGRMIRAHPSMDGIVPSTDINDRLEKGICSRKIAQLGLPPFV